MSESAGEKTEEPTPKKLEDARKKGSVAQSQDVNKLFITLSGFEILIAMNSYFLNKYNELLISSFDFVNVDLSVFFEIMLHRCLEFTLMTSGVVLLGVIISRFLASFIQYGILISPSSLVPNFSKFSPINQVKNMFGKQKLVELLGNFIKAIVLTIVFLYIIRYFMSYILLLSYSDLEQSINFSIDLFSMASRISLLIFLVIAALDFKIQKSIFTKKNMMTKDEVFREYKQMEGDPHIKGQRRQLFSELANSNKKVNIQDSIPDADAIVVNPSHFAVALEYKPGSTPLPLILCKGQDSKALDIIRLAKESDVPVIRYISLARTLYRTGKEGQYIPKTTIQGMATVLKLIREIDEFKEQNPEYQNIKWRDMDIPVIDED